MTAALTGYLSEDYARSFHPAHETVTLHNSGGHLLRRPIGNSGRHDLAGLYPFLCCRDWTALRDDIGALGSAPVSIVTATDPFGDYDGATLERAFDFARPFKEHFVIDTAVPLAGHVKKSHRETAARALRRVEVRVVEDTASKADEWVRLYAVLCERHGISGLRRFSPQMLKDQLAVPGLVMFEASSEGHTIGLDLWYVQNGCAQGHLAAFDEEGYRLRASYATKFFLIEHFRSRVAWINLGGGTGDQGGLTDFKRGFASGTRMSWICGKVFDRAAYDELTKQKGVGETAFFPAYRAGEVF